MKKEFWAIKMMAIVFALSFFSSCGKDSLPSKPIGMAYVSPYDSTVVVTFEENEKGHYLCLLKDWNIVKEVLIPTRKKEINAGYGETTNYETTPNDIFFLKNRIIVTQKSFEDKFSAFDLFSNDIKYIKGIDFDESCYPSYWDGNIFFVLTSNNDKIIKVMNDQGVVIDELNKSSESELPDIEDHNIFFDNYEFIAIKNNQIKRNSVKSGMIWRVIYSQYVKNKPETETNSPKIQYIGYSIKDDVVSIKLDVTYYSGEKEQLVLKLDADTGEIK